jgi:tRNA(Ile)-lysidine synthetase-like protein
MKKIFKNFVNKNRLTDKKVVVAVSGGRDSMVLLWLCAKFLGNKNVIAAHIDHGIRDNSHQDAEFVSEYCKNNKIMFLSKKLELKSHSEDAARRLRYAALKSIQKKVDAICVMVGHHQDDNIETILFNIMRGTDLAGLVGMSPLSGKVARPLLAVSRGEITAFAEKNNISWVEDQTNKENKYARNRLRNIIIPELEKISPKFKDNLLKLAGEFANIRAQELSEVSPLISAYKENGFVDEEEVLKLTPRLQSVFVRELFRDLFPQKEITAKNISEILKMFGDTKSKKTSVGGVCAVFEAGKFYLNPKLLKPQNNKLLKLKTKTVFGGHTLFIKRGAAVARKNNILLSASLNYNLSVRTWLPGDKIRTKSGSKKVQDIFTDHKVPKSQRDFWPIIVDGSELVWIPGLCAYDKALNKSTNCLIIEVRNEKE